MKRLYSYSRRNTLERCLALYFYEYYASATKSPLEQHKKARIGRLKQMSATALLAGQILHRMIRLSITRTDLPATWIQRTALADFDKAIIFARNPKAQSYRLDERYPPKELVEFSYRDRNGENAASRARKKLASALKNFFFGPSIRDYMASLQNHTLVPEKRLRGMKEAGWTIGGQVDLLATNDTACEVADWKLGNQERGTDSLQLHIYGEFVALETGLPLERISMRRVFLGDAAVEAPTHLSKNKSQLGRMRLIQDIELMEELHAYARDGREGVFTKCDHKNICRRCKFQAICHDTPMSQNSLLI